jgi:hypothetical protein
MSAPAVGDRFVYLSPREFYAPLNGQPCTLIAIYDESIQWPYAVRFDDGIELYAVDRQLAPIAADGSVGEPMQPAPGTRRGWDAYSKMIKHSKNPIFATMDTPDTTDPMEKSA